MNLPGILGKVFAGGAGTVVKQVLDGADALFTSKEEKLKLEMDLTEKLHNYEVRQKELALEELKAEFADTANARDTNTRIQESEHASWLSKNVGYILDMVFTASFIAMLFVIIYKVVPKENKELFYTAFGALGSYVTLILGFHRGTSAGSSAKQKHIENLNKGLKK